MSQFVQYNPQYKSLGQLAALEGLWGKADGAITGVSDAYAHVPWLYRAVQLRANTVSRLGWSLENEQDEDVLGEPEYRNVEMWLKQRLFQCELSLCLFGAAYFLVEENKFGLNKTPRFIPYPSVTPVVDQARGVTGFTISLSSGMMQVPLDRMIYVWLPSATSEVAPGPAPADVALRAAGMLYAVDTMTQNYFKAGAVPITAVKVPPTTPKEEKEKLEGWFNRFASGFRNAWKFLPVNQNTEFETIGSAPKDAQATELTETQRANVAVGLGVPPSVIDGNSANFATAQSEMMGFYLNTIFPEADLIAESFNAQLFDKLGLELCNHPEKIEIFQSSELEQAKTLFILTGSKAVMTVDEAREWLDLEPMPSSAASALSTPAASAPSAASAPMIEAPVTDAQAKAWLELSLENLHAAACASCGAPWDAELMAASSGRMVRGIFSAHWPRAKAEPAAVLNRYLDYVEAQRHG